METNERKTFKEWYEFNRSLIDEDSKFFVTIKNDQTDEKGRIDRKKICMLEGNLDYIISLVGNLKVMSFTFSAFASNVFEIALSLN